jgi:hypothetical protein
MGHRVTQRHVEEVNRGDLIQVAGGYVIADTLSARSASSADLTPVPFWYDTDGERHYPNPTDNTLTVVDDPPFQTHAHGRSAGKDAAGHALDKADAALCPDGRRSGTLDKLESGTALAAVTCKPCRRIIGLVGQARGERKRESNGI